MNREEEELDAKEVLEEIGYYPEKVPKIITKTRNDGDSEFQLLLEQDETGYNYKKFFDAIAVANHDVWDDKIPEFTSLRPVGNTPNRTEYTLKNQEISDAVRQFAIDWYLDEAVKQLSVEAKYSDELYDHALYLASVQALDYLIPFFENDLDSVYAILWDSEENGGVDQDCSTLSADMRSDTYYYGVSSYLPYGTYVIVEQQPRYAQFGDWKNRHYEIDEPREILIPTVNEEYDENYVHREVPWSVPEPGYASRRFYNPIYSVKLRIEKLDAVTHENIFHDDAVFRIYKGRQNEDPFGDGEALFYEEPTMICGSQEFLEAMKAKHIQPMSRGMSLWGQLMESPIGPGTLY